MLRQENPNSEQDAVAARTRVTPEELARALSAIEARNADHARHLDGTIPIGQAVQELELDATPSEVWAEVQAQRQAVLPPQAAPVSSPTTPVPPLPQTLARSLREAATAAAPGLKDAAHAATPALRQGWQAVSQRAAARSVRFGGKPMGKGAKIFMGVFLSIGLIGAIVDGSHGSHAHWEAVSTTPDGRTIMGDTASVAELTHGVPQSAVRVLNGDSLDNGWQLIRHNGRVYVRGWILPQSTAKIQAGPVKLYNDDNAGELEEEHVEQVTLPLDSLTLDGTAGSDDWSELDISHIHPDDHLQENW